MQFDYPLLEALAAVVREGSFDGAARALNITQSAVSQRLKLLEEKCGAVLVVRGRPCVATEYGQQLYRHIEQVQLLEHDLTKNLTSIDNPTASAPAVIRIAVNRDSLATWFPEVVQRAAVEMNLRFDLIPDDQEHTAEKLRSGEALAAVTAESSPMQGCRRIPIGAMEYVAVATPRFVATHFPDGVNGEAAANAPQLNFDRKDTLQRRWLLNAFGEEIPLTGHLVPSYSGYLRCCLGGVGWGLVLRFSVEEALQEGRMVELVPGSSVMVPLYWQSSGQGSEIMKLLSATVAEVARKHLLPDPQAPQAGGRFAAAAAH